ncbi:hypothetical protein JTE90_005966 [Oedothorax gibbosus]|uniref:Uncharacterized protein n=1 Tax=Oedothorax gibbosus TaxID=931172 RepID=A0AAV6UZB4_9ARAC|nr:hypothetical protein JTE90_005966 [Oedothorax gibbosus]
MPRHPQKPDVRRAWKFVARGVLISWSGFRNAPLHRPFVLRMGRLLLCHRHAPLRTNNLEIALPASFRGVMIPGGDSGRGMAGGKWVEMVPF